MSLSLAFLANPAEDAEDSGAIKEFALQGIIYFNPMSSFCAPRSSAYLEEDELPVDPSPVTHPITFPEQHPCCADIKVSAWANVHVGRVWRRTRLRWGLQPQELTFWG